MVQNKTKDYLGDGVYVELNEYGQLVLETSDGIRVSNRIFLEPEVFLALNRFTDRMVWPR